jgi:hypothetical protein
MSKTTSSLAGLIKRLWSPEKTAGVDTVASTTD